MEDIVDGAKEESNTTEMNAIDSNTGGDQQKTKDDMQDYRLLTRASEAFERFLF